MEVTDEGIDTETRELQPSKALSPMEVTDEGMSTCPFASGVYRQAADATQLAHTSARTVRTRTHSQDRAPRRCQAPALVRPISGRGMSIPGMLAEPQSGAAQRGEQAARRRAGGRAAERESELCAKGTGSCSRRRLCAS